MLKITTVRCKKNLLSQIDSDLTAEEYIDFDARMCTAEPAIDSDQVDWREASTNVCIKEHQHGTIEVAEDSDGDNDDESMMEDIPDFRISPQEALVLLDKITCTTGIDAEDRE